jgi:choline monooxygenase
MGFETLLPRDALAAINRPTAEAECLPSALYTRPEVLDRERQRLFFDDWVCVAAGGQIPNAGDVLPVEVAGAPVVLVREREGGLRAFHNVCSHRGMKLVGAPQQKKRALVCPYHSWTYGLDGALRDTPHFEGPNRHEPCAFDRAAMGLKEVRLATWHDLVFVNISGTAEPLAATTAPLDARWRDYDFSTLRYERTVTFEVQANWKLAVENFLESYHLPWAHPGLNSYSRMEDHACMVEPNFLGQLSDAYFSDRAGHGALPRFPALPNALAHRAEYPTMLPNLMLGVHPDYFFAFTAEPRAAELTHETFHFWFVGEAALAPELKPQRDRVVESWGSINREDIFVVEGMQAGRHSPAYRGARFSAHHEPTTHEFQRRIANRLAS